MASSLYREQSSAFKRVLAAEMGCEPADYESHALTVVERPPGSREPHLALLTTCGTGSVVSLRDPRLIPWVRAQSLPANQRIFLPSFLEGLASAARDLGHEDAKSHSATCGTVLAEDLPPRPLPDGYSLREIDIATQQRLRETLKFDNALSEPDETRRIATYRTAFAVESAAGETVAVAGVWDQYPGVDEIGLDVLRDYRGHGLASILTIHATRWIRAQGRIPIYTFGFTNVRSMNNALACGFRPLWFLSAVYVPSDMA